MTVPKDELAGMITEYLDTPLPDTWDDLSVEDRVAFIQGRSPLELGQCTKRRDVVCISEIRCELCGEDRAKGGGSDVLSRKISNIMNNMPEWENTGRRMRLPGYGQQRVYIRRGTVELPKPMTSEEADQILQDAIRKHKERQGS